MAELTVTANSWNIRPMTPLIRRSGINTATSDTDIERIVKPISSAPFSAACSGGNPLSIWRGKNTTTKTGTYHTQNTPPKKGRQGGKCRKNIHKRKYPTEPLQRTKKGTR